PFGQPRASVKTSGAQSIFGTSRNVPESWAQVRPAVTFKSGGVMVFWRRPADSRPDDAAGRPAGALHGVAAVAVAHALRRAHRVDLAVVRDARRVGELDGVERVEVAGRVHGKRGHRAVGADDLHLAAAL